MHPRRSEVTGQLKLTCPVSIHQWTEKTSVPQRVTIIPPFPLDLMRRDLQVCVLCPRVLVRPPSSRLHLSADILFFPASDLRCGLERISLVGSVQEYFTPCWCHSWMELICIICCLKQHATICSVMQHAPTGQLYPRNAFAGTSRAAVGEVLIYSFQHQPRGNDVDHSVITDFIKVHRRSEILCFLTGIGGDQMSGRINSIITRRWLKCTTTSSTILRCPIRRRRHEGKSRASNAVGAAGIRAS